MTDKQYCEEREIFIPDAQVHANKVAGPRPEGCGDEWAAKWNKAFHMKMEELWKAHEARR